MNSKNTEYPSGFGVQEPSREAQDLLRRRTEEGLQKVKSFSFVQLCLALVTTACGLATLIVASENLGFPVFNFGPLLTGILVFLAGGLGFHAGRKGLQELGQGKVEPATNCMVRANFGVSIATISIATISAVFAFLSGAVCAGADIQFYSGGRGSVRTPIDVEQYCHPNKGGNVALAFIDGVLCVLIVVWVLLGLCFYCSYGPLFGIRRRMR